MSKPMAAKKTTKKKKSNLPAIDSQPILQPFDISKIGTNNDPCFGKHYDLSEKACRICGDSEMCCIVFAQKMGVTRKNLEKDSKFKDIEVLYDLKAIEKYIRLQKKKGSSKKDILDNMQSKFEVTREEARQIYRNYNNKN